MIIITEKSKCCGCQACYSVCPTQCINMELDTEGFLYPLVDQSRCVDCGMCEKVCPFFESKRNENTQKVFASKCKDDDIRINSSSGGLFSVLAKEVLRENGVVFGAAFSNNFREVIHIKAVSEEELDKLKRSKYVQSIVGEAYKDVEKQLLSGKIVLFSGVPCQVTGLRRYLQKNYDNLICVDLICHGVPSPKLWQKYLTNIEDKNAGSITDINFRHKKCGLQNFGISRTEDGVEIFTSIEFDTYMQMFMRNYSLRPSCFNCQPKAEGSTADISLGDFWGINNIAPEMNDGKGTSAVVIYSEKGLNLLEKIATEIEKKEVAFKVVKQYNSPIYKSVNRPEERDCFFSDMNNMSYDILAEKYCIPQKTTIKQKLGSSKLWKFIRPIFRGQRTQTNNFEYGIYINVRKS